MKAFHFIFAANLSEQSGQPLVLSWNGFLDFKIGFVARANSH